MVELTEVPGTEISSDPVEVHVVKSIEHLGAELDAVALLEPPVLCQGEIDILCGRHPYDSRAQAAEC